MFSLCIATIDRFDSFLKQYLPEYIQNDLISEIIVCDENGNDVKKIAEAFGDGNGKLKLVTNESRLGPFLNKLKCCRLASNTWIALIDSDNFADRAYFDTVKAYIEQNDLVPTTILSPCWAKPTFDYRHLAGKILNRSTLRVIREQETLEGKIYTTNHLINTGNYVIHRYLLDGLDITKEIENIQYSSSCDVIYVNTLFMEQMNANIHVVPNLYYDHAIHDGSVFRQTCATFGWFNELIYNRFNDLVLKGN